MTSALWLFGVREIYQEIFKVGHGVNFDVSLWLIIGPVSVVIAWSCYNRGRYRGLNRRAATKPLSAMAKASSFGVTDPEFIGKLEQRRMELEFQPDGQLARLNGFAHPGAVHVHAPAISLEMFGTRSTSAGNRLPIMENQAF
jgi:poly-beta-1,6-N-acetyl-D-glucosamine biosynthesis protein PgaD